MSDPEVLMARAGRLVHAAAQKAAHEGRTRWSRGYTQRTCTPVVIDDAESPSVLIEAYAAAYEDVLNHVVLWDPHVAEAVGALLEEAAEDCACYMSTHNDTERFDHEASNIWRFEIDLAYAIRDSYVPPAHYECEDGTACCVHAVPAAPGSCDRCWELL